MHSQLASSGVGGATQWLDFQAKDYHLNKTYNRQQKSDCHQRPVGIPLVAEKYDEFLNFAQKFSKINKEDSDFSWQWFPVGLLGLICWVAAYFIFLFTFSSPKGNVISFLAALGLAIVGLLIGIYGFAHWAN